MWLYVASGAADLRASNKSTEIEDIHFYVASSPRKQFPMDTVFIDLIPVFIRILVIDVDECRVE